ncbi:amidohydrolase family protein [Streptomyces liangshanensis]|uniref:Amidohydrolase family protein n=1 Tax=Streptomyces liangshanensis TaxID=2717324 RepID=A0A6G9H6W3_9ACTN|nr:amidohydrolase family protein [Streptomyces liangshanensis]QIQ06046.1 amidohydrolase family protein [Streptomyces liangshanensis]
MVTVLRNVRVFDGRRVREPSSVVLRAGRIGGQAVGAELVGAEVVDGDGGVLMAGLIDAHVHLDEVGQLDRLRAYGITTALDMGARPGFIATLRGSVGLPDVRSAGTAAIGPGSPHESLVGPEGVVAGPGAAEGFLADRGAEGSDYLKIIVGDPSPSHDQATLDALVVAARSRGLLVVAHALSHEAVDMAQRAGVDILTHTPKDRLLSAEAVARTVEDGRAVVPTLALAELLDVRAGTPGDSHGTVRANTAALYRAGVPLLAGTDAHVPPWSGPYLAHGESLHRELELLVDAGLSTVDALRAATVLPARYFALADRGVVEPGRRADLVLLDGDPVSDITATRAIRRVWCGGLAYTAP